MFRRRGAAVERLTGGHLHRSRRSPRASAWRPVFTCETAGQGAATTVVAAVAPEFERSGGLCLDDGQEACTVPGDAGLARHPHGVKTSPRPGASGRSRPG
ncbi:hypothetical protein ACU635_29600 [[Actinomadura] parvosata]|uniref:hypothetical protein n=1 Tax=[Actinomadura] parvosata TaxID=1955412 RepID=UPI00406C62F2